MKKQPRPKDQTKEAELMAMHGNKEVSVRDNRSQSTDLIALPGGLAPIRRKEEVSLHLEGPAIEAEVVSSQEEGKEEVKVDRKDTVKPLSMVEKQFMYEEAIRKCDKIIEKAQFDKKNYKIRLRKLLALIKAAEEI
jgi:hypothetical protein